MIDCVIVVNLIYYDYFNLVGYGLVLCYWLIILVLCYSEVDEYLILLCYVSVDGMFFDFWQVCFIVVCICDVYLQLLCVKGYDYNFLFDGMLDV